MRDSDSTGISIENGAAVTLTNSRVLRSGVNDGNAWAINVVLGSLTATRLNVASGRNGVLVQSGGTNTASVTGSSFTGLTGTAASNGNKDFASFVATGSWWGDAAGPNDPSNADGRLNANAAGQNMTMSLAGQYGRHNISFCAVNPGPVRTERWAGLVTAMSRDMGISYEEADKLAPASIALGRIAEVEEVANLVVMLASPLVQMANGTMIEIDGGQDKALMDRFRDR